MSQSKTVWDKIWKDKNGLVVLWQSPNLPLITWALFAVISHFIHLGTLKSGAQFISTSFLFVWAYLEITSGVNYFRRGVGMIVFISIIASHI